MQSLETGRPTMSQMDVIKYAWDKIRTQLETEKARIYEAIVHYPTPIAGCDQQFNYLLEEQTRIRHELERLNEARNKSLIPGDVLQQINQFIGSSSYVDPEMQQTIQSYLQEGLSQIQP